MKSLRVFFFSLPAAIDIVIGQWTFFIFRVFLIVGDAWIIWRVHHRLLRRHGVDTSRPFPPAAHAVFRLLKGKIQKNDKLAY